MTAACASHPNPDLWFTTNEVGIRAAKAVCAGCEMAASCLAGALAREEPNGVWGGRSFDLAAEPFALIEPTAARLQASVKAPMGCGSHAAYIRGCRCDACKKAHAETVADSRENAPVTAPTTLDDVETPEQLNLLEMA